jgi:hypothetical protein
MRFKTRLKALERPQNGTEEDSFRLVVSLVSQPANLANSSSGGRAVPTAPSSKSCVSTDAATA